MFLGETMMDIAYTLFGIFAVGFGGACLLTLFGKVMTRITGKRWY